MSMNGKIVLNERICSTHTAFTTVLENTMSLMNRQLASWENHL